MNFRVAPVHKALVSASKVCRKGYRIILDSKPGRRGMLHKRTNEGNDSWEEKIGVCQFDTVRTQRSCCTCGFSQAGESSVRPQDEDQPMIPDDVQASEEVGDEEAIPAKALPSPTQPTRKEIQEHVLTHLPPRSWCRHCLRERRTSLPHFRSKTEGSMWCRLCQSITSSWVHLDKRKHMVCSQCWQ